MGVERRIECTALAPLYSGVVAVVVVAAALLFTSVPEWTADIETTMVSTEESYVNRIATEKANFSNTYLGVVRSQLGLVRQFTLDVLNDRAEAIVNETVYDTAFGSTGSVPGYSASTSESLDAVGYWQCNDGAPVASCGGIADASLSSTARKRRALASLVAMPFRALQAGGLARGAGGFWSVSYEADGMLVQYPFQPHSDPGGFPSSSYTCYADGATYSKTGYDPRCRGWYEDARTENGYHFTSPYFFASATPELGLTAAVPFQADVDPITGVAPSQLTGMAMLDFSIPSIDSTVKATVLRNGYGYIVGEDGRATVHPDLDWSVATIAPSIVALEFPDADVSTNPAVEPSDPEANAFWTDILPSMRALESGTERFTKNGVEWLVAWRPAANAGYSVAVTVPSSDVRAPFVAARAEIQAGLIAAVVVSGMILVVFAAAACYITRLVASAVATPVERLDALVSRINSHDFSGDPPVRDDSIQTLELSSLFKVFRQLYTVIRFANASATAGDAEHARTLYEESLTLFRGLNNKRGEGLALNNLGGIYLQLKKPSDAVRAFQSAVENASAATESFYRTSDDAGAGAGDAETGGGGGVELARGGDGRATEVVMRTESVRGKEAAALARQEARRRSNLSKALLARGEDGDAMAAATQLRHADAIHTFLLSLDSCAPALEDAVRDSLKRSGLDKPAVEACARTDVIRSQLTTRCEWVHALTSESLRYHPGHPERTAAAESAREALGAVVYAWSQFRATLATLSPAGRIALTYADEPEESDAGASEAGRPLAYDPRSGTYDPRAAAGGRRGPGHAIVSNKSRRGPALIPGIKPEPEFVTGMRVALAEARVARAEGDTMHAIATLDAALSAPPVIERRVASTLAAELASLLRDLGEDEAAAAATSPLREVHARDIILLIDHSGSMAGGRIRRTVAATLDLFDHQVRDTDRVALFAFNDRVSRTFGLTPVQGMRDSLRRRIEADDATSRQTAMYDALATAMDEFKSSGSGASAGRRQVIVALTDGADNRSVASPASLTSRLAADRNTTLIIIGVGELDNRPTLERLCAASKDGAFVHADGTENLAAAFKEAERLMSGPEIALEQY